MSFGFFTVSGIVSFGTSESKEKKKKKKTED